VTVGESRKHEKKMNEKNYDKVLLMLLLVVLSQMSCLVAMAQDVYEFPEDVNRDAMVAGTSFQCTVSHDRA